MESPTATPASGAATGKTHPVNRQNTGLARRRTARTVLGLHALTSGMFVPSTGRTGLSGDKNLHTMPRKRARFEVGVRNRER
jgi:hypothetical protein